ncbi:DUF72 domain-containing protein [Pseudonocardia hispaniensis]|uniref:DUF72 domain-containing protein n=1 Tax=Pseudonocardia hispaniensis TaxID=904933 RepID=A0ABW1J5H5_9PSEU
MRIGTSGWRYPCWRGVFYPPGLVQRAELGYLSRTVTSIEINGSFYSLQRPQRYRAWAADTPDDFVFAVKGPRFVTHLKQLRDVETPLANFFASGVLALGRKLGPVLWQLPPRMRFDRARLITFLDQLPRSTGAAAELASRHDERLDGWALTSTDAERPVRHALEVRHPSFACAELVELVRERGIALVVADSAGSWPHLEDMTAGHCYVRLHGDAELYTSGYSPAALANWAAKVRAWHAGESPVTPFTVGPPGPRLPAGRDVYVYFDNDIKAHAPRDAIALAALLTRG